MTGITKWLVEHTVEDSSNQKAPMPRSGSRTMVALVVGCCALMWNAPREKDMQHREKDMQHNREPTLSPGVRGESRPAARDQEKKIANAIQAGESKAQRP
jgi:hypothetical protein